MRQNDLMQFGGVEAASSFLERHTGGESGMETLTPQELGRVTRIGEADLDRSP